MKALEIIQEEGKPTIGGLVKSGWETLTKRLARDKLLRQVFKEASDDLSEQIYQQARKSQLLVKTASDWEHIFPQAEIEKALLPHIQKIKFENFQERKEFAEKVYAEAMKKAQSKYKEAIENTRAINDPTGKTKKTPANINDLTTKTIDVITATGIYLNIAEPISDYSKNIQNAAAQIGKPNSKGVVITQEHFDSYAREELGILVGRLALLMVPFGTIGAGLRAFRNVASAVPGLSWIAPRIQDANGAKIFYLIWAELMNSNKKLSDLTGSSDALANKSPKEILTFLLLKEIPVPLFTASFADIFGFGGKLTLLDKGIENFHPEAPYNALKSLYNSAVQKYTEYFGKQGRKVDPTTLEPEQNQKPPASSGVKPGEFNPDDWVQVGSGFYQNKKDNSMMSPAEWAEKTGQSK